MLMAVQAMHAQTGTPAGTDIRNQAWGSYELKYGDPDTVRSNTTSTIVQPPSGSPRLGLAKQADRGTAAPGTDITYTIILANTGDAAGTGVTITDTLPANTGFVSATSGGILSGRVVRWSLPTIGIGASDTVLLVARVDAGAAAGTISNQARAACREGIDTASNVAATQVTTFIATTLNIAATPKAIVGDGLDTTRITAIIRDNGGRRAPDGTAVRISATHGRFANGADTVTAVSVDGVANAVLRGEVLNGTNITSTVHASLTGSSGLKLRDSTTSVFYLGAVAGVAVSGVNASGASGVSLAAYDDGGSAAGRDTTGADGVFIVPVGRRGVHRLAVTHVTRFGDRVVRTVSMVVNAGTTSGVAATHAPNAISGQLVDRNTGTPLRTAGIAVTLRPVNLGKPAGGAAGSATVLTTDIGGYLFDSLTPGRYELSVSDARYRGSATIADTIAGEYMIDAPLQVSEVPNLTIAITSTKRIVESGDAVGYTVVVGNRSSETVLGAISVIDTLPPGFGLARGHAHLDSAAITEPAGSRHVSWHIPAGLSPGQNATLTYFAIAGAGAIDGDGLNRVQAVAVGPSGDSTFSAPAQALVTVRPGVFTDHGLVLGQVFYDANGNGRLDGGEDGPAGIELWLEDGTRVVTGDHGRYSLPDVVPGDRVLRINAATIPTGARLQAGGTAFAGDARSRFIHVAGGGIARADFVLQPPAQMSLHLIRADSVIADAQGSARAGYVVRRIQATATRTVMLRDTLPPGLYFDLARVRINESALELGGRTRILALDLQRYLNRDSNTIWLTIVADSAGIAKPIVPKPRLILSYPAGADAVFTPQPISMLLPEEDGDGKPGSRAIHFPMPFAGSIGTGEDMRAVDTERSTINGRRGVCG
ncbi:MAG TPA: hypothetical protein VHI13_06900 [Candidatus Kapabacteria bacterium]|nr:hypothetical protein [Candidatus Kapabacteria bacterium]